MPAPITDLFGLRHPIVLAPMGAIAGGHLAAAVSAAGGLGMIGAGYNDDRWIDRQFDAAEGARVGIGFITWDLARSPERLATALARGPAAVMGRDREGRCLRIGDRPVLYPQLPIARRHR